MNTSNPGQPSPKILWTHFHWTVDRFAEILKNEKTDYYRDAALQRFTFTCDSALKLIRSLASEKGKALESLTDSLQWAVDNQWLPKDAPWNEMDASYKLATLKLKDEGADREYEKLASYCKLMKTLCDQLAGVVDQK